MQYLWYYSKLMCFARLCAHLVLKAFNTQPAVLALCPPAIAEVAFAVDAAPFRVANRQTSQGIPPEPDQSAFSNATFARTFCLR